MSARSRAKPWFWMAPPLRDLSQRFTTADMVAALWDYATARSLYERNACTLPVFFELPAAFGWRIDNDFFDFVEGR